MQADLTPVSAATKSAAKSARGGPPRRMRSFQQCKCRFLPPLFVVQSSEVAK
jgi:hypothetical protein